MAGKSATLTVKIVSDATNAGKGFADAEKKAGGFQKALGKASLVAGGAVAAIGAVAVSAFNAASDLQQSTGAIDSVFGDWAIDIEQSAQAAADAVGLSASAYENLAAVIGSQLKGTGMNIGDVTAKTQDLVAMGADLAATFGGTTADAVGALSSVLKGETDPIEAYGVSIKQSDINARLASLGQDKLTGSALKQATANAALALVTEQTASAQGAFAREGDTAAGAQARMSAQLENTKAKLGEQLLPLVAEGVTKLTEFATWVGNNSGLAKILAGVFGALAAAVWITNLAMAANPMGIFALAIGAVIAALVLAYNKVGWFRDAVNAAGRVIASAFDAFKDALSWVWDKLQSLWNLAGKVGGALGKLNPFGAAAPTPPAPAGGVAGLYGAAPGVYAAGSMLSSSSGSATGSARTATPAASVVNITVNGALDAQGVARQLRTMLRDLDVSTGRRVTVTA